MNAESYNGPSISQSLAARYPVRVVVFAPSLIPSVVIGVLRPLVALEKLGEVSLRLRFSTMPAFADVDINWCNVAVFCRNSELGDLRYLYKLKQRGKRVIYEIDDNFEEIPLNTAIGIHHRAFHRLHVFRRFVSISDLVRVYSERMRHRAEAYNADVWVVRSYFDADILKGEPAPRISATVKIAYPTGRIDDPRLEQILFDALRQVLVIHCGRVELHLWRKSCPAQLAGIDGVVLQAGVSNYEAFVKSFYSQGFHIGLAPLIDEPFFQSKSNNKYREFGGCAVAGIYSDMPPYSDCVVNEKSGLLVANTASAWVAAIDRLVRDEQLRSAMAKQAQQDVTENYSFARAVESYRKAIREVGLKPAKPCDWLYDERLSCVASYVDSSTNASVNDAGCEFNRLKQFQSAARALGFEYYPKADSESFLAFHAIQNESAVVVFVINSMKDLEAAGMYFPLCRSIILDLSMLEASVEEFGRAYEHVKLKVSVSLLLSSERGDMLSLAKDLNIPCGEVSPTLSAIESNYSLSGYCAAYMDLLEKHRRYSRLPRRSRLTRVINRLSRRGSTLIEASVGRLRRAWSLFQWRLGRRPL